MSKKNRRPQSAQEPQEAPELDLSEATVPGEAEAPEEGAEEPESTPAASVAARYFLAPRKSIVTRGRGIIHDPGAEIFADDFAAGVTRLEDLAAGGVLVKQ